MSMDDEYNRFISELGGPLAELGPDEPEAAQPVAGPSSALPPPLLAARPPMRPPPLSPARGVLNGAAQPDPAGPPGAPPLAPPPFQPPPAARQPPNAPVASPQSTAGRLPAAPPSIPAAQLASAPAGASAISGLPGPPALPPAAASQPGPPRPSGAPPALQTLPPRPAMPPPALPQNVSYGSVPFAAYGAAPAAAPPQQRYAAGGFDVTTLNPEALRAEILGEKKSGAKRKAPKEGQLRVAGGETWIDDKLDIWPENDFRIFVGNLGPEVNEDVLARAFQPFPSYVKCRIIKDYKKCKAKAYGFVSFTNHLEGAKALRAMHGKYIGNRPCQLKKSTHTARNAPADGKKRAAMLANPMERITTKRMR